MPWIDEFRDRLDRFDAMFAPRDGEVPVSVEVRVDSGCYSRSCCPHAFSIIDRKVQQLRTQGERFVLQEHETGPEIIVYLLVTSAGLKLLGSIVDLATTVIKARFVGRRQGDRHDDAVRLVVRRLESADTLVEERLVTFRGSDKVTKRIVKEVLLTGCEKISPNVRGKRGKKKGAKRPSARGTGRC